MQCLNKNNVIIILSISLLSTLFIKGGAQLNNKTANSCTSKALMDSRPFKLDQKKGINSLVINHSNLDDNQIIQTLQDNNPLTVLQTLSYLWSHIDQYQKHEKIMQGVEYLAKADNDKRVSGLAKLVSGKLLQQKITVVKNTLESNAQWEALEHEGLIAQEEQSESDYEKLDLASVVEDSPLYSNNNEEREQYIDHILSHSKSPNIDEIATLLQDVDEEVSVAAADTLISFLNQGVGDPKEIVEVIEENIALLDELQIQSFKEILQDVAKSKQD